MHTDRQTHTDTDTHKTNTHTHTHKDTHMHTHAHMHIHAHTLTTLQCCITPGEEGRVVNDDQELQLLLPILLTAYNIIAQHKYTHTMKFLTDKTFT